MKDNLKNIIRNYILENQDIEPEDQEDVDTGADVDSGDIEDIGPSDGFISIIQKRNPILRQQLARVQNPKTKLEVLDEFTDFILGAMGTSNLPPGELRNWALKKFQGQTNEAEIDEMSTSAGAGTYNSKYAYKIKKKK